MQGWQPTKLIQSRLEDSTREGTMVKGIKAQEFLGSGECLSMFRL